MDKGELKFYKIKVNGHLVGLSRDIDEILKMYHAVKEAVEFLEPDAGVVLWNKDDTVLD